MIESNKLGAVVGSFPDLPDCRDPFTERANEIDRTRERFAHLDRVLRMCEESDDPIYRTAAALWKAIAGQRRHGRRRHTVNALVLPPVLDPCCGPRMWWFDHADARALFGDRRRETLTVKDTSHGRADGRRVLRIEPDVDLDFRAMPFADDTFHLVAFDPPHLVRAGAQSWMAAKYGKLGLDWREDLRAGFAECFRVLRTHGVLVFKWNETQVKVREVLALTPEAPLFGTTSGRKSGTHWIVFMKPNAEAHGRAVARTLQPLVGDSE